MLAPGQEGVADGNPVAVDEELGWSADEAPEGPAGGGGAAAEISVRAGKYGGSLERIARAHLPEGASQADITSYVGQLFEINGIADARAIQPEDEILLPDANTAPATEGRGLYFKDIAVGEQLKAAAQATTEKAAAQVPDDFLDRIRQEDEQWAASQMLAYAQGGSAASQGTLFVAPTDYSTGRYDRFGVRHADFCMSCHDETPTAKWEKQQSLLANEWPIFIGEQAAGLAMGYFAGTIASAAAPSAEAMSGALPLRDPLILTGAGEGFASEGAEAAYAQIRALRMTDVAAVSENTGLSLSETITLKKHLFFGRHAIPLEGGEGFRLARFDAMDDIAFAWKTSQEGALSTEQQAWMRQLAQHELGERSLMGRGLPYRNPLSWDDRLGIFGTNPPGAHDLAPRPPKQMFPGYKPW
jgi:hypothetical protein